MDSDYCINRRSCIRPDGGALQSSYESLEPRFDVNTYKELNYCTAPFSIIIVSNDYKCGCIKRTVCSSILSNLCLNYWIGAVAVSTSKEVVNCR